MNENYKIPSLYRALLMTSFIVIMIAAIGAVSVISYIAIEDKNENTFDIASEKMQKVANFSIPYLNKSTDLSEAEYDELKNQLENLVLFDINSKVTNVHIYKYQADTKPNVVFFESYNRSTNSQGDSKAIKDSTENITDFLTPQQSQLYYEVAREIKYDDKLIGYVWIRLNNEEVANLKKKLFLAAIVVLLLFMPIILFVVLRIQKIVEAPLFDLKATAQEISKKKDYSQRFNVMSFREIESVSEQLNILLGRTEKHIAKQDDTEQEVLKLNQELEDKVGKRTEALKESNQELLSTLEKLHQYQGQLVESEKMASLGDMVAGVAHEVNTPIGLGVTASTLLSDRLDEITTAYNDKTLRSSQLKKFLSDGQENIGIIIRNLNRAADLISSFKKVAVDQSNEEDRLFNVKELCNEVLLTLAPQIKNLPHEIIIDCPEELMIYSKPGPINQILINLILNSIIHGFENQEHGEINIHIMPMSEQLNIYYKDNGRGIEEKIKNKVFDPFTTTKRGEGGSGLGLHLVYNLVTQALGGTILLDSTLGEGTSFEINFPIKQTA